MERCESWTKICWAKIGRSFVRPPFPILENSSINLHLGCGSVVHPKFVNVDLVPAPHVHYVRSIDDLSPFKDNSVSLIHASHCLEHFPHGKVAEVLREWFRVLKKDGILRLSVPNFDVVLDIYNENRGDINIIMSILMGAQNYKYNFHKVAFTKSSLSLLLKMWDSWKSESGKRLVWTYFFWWLVGTQSYSVWQRIFNKP